MTGVQTCALPICYLTRRLVDVSQDLIIREIDCAEGKDEIPGMWVSEFTDGKEQIESLQDRITGRFSCETIKDKDGNVIVKANHMITPKRAARVIKDGINENGEHYTKVKIRTILTCRSGNGICAKCYGANMATGEAVQVGESVGIIAAQSIGEPGTQLTMRTFHTGGVAGGDITQGLPRVEELFEARKPKGLAIITEIPGVAQIKDTKKKREIVVTNPDDGVSKTYLIPYGSRIKIADGTVLEAGDELTEGSVNPHDILKIKGVRAVQDYMLREVQRVYRLQGVEINDKHIEVIVRQMLKKIRIEENGDTEFLPGDMVDFLEYDETNKALIAEGKEPAEGKQVLLGITKASLASDSFLSAASFQETTKVLTDAAIKGKVDHLVGRSQVEPSASPWIPESAPPSLPSGTADPPQNTHRHRHFASPPPRFPRGLYRKFLFRCPAKTPSADSRLLPAAQAPPESFHTASQPAVPSSHAFRQFGDRKSTRLNSSHSSQSRMPSSA